jgi:hypothetical protein
MVGRAVAQAVSHRVPTAAALVRTQVRSCGTCGGQGGTEAGFLRVLRFPLPILIPPTAPHSSGAGTMGQLWPTYQVDSVSPHPKKLKKNKWLIARDDFISSPVLSIHVFCCCFMYLSNTKNCDHPADDSYKKTRRRLMLLIISNCKIHKVRLKKPVPPSKLV